MNIKKLRKLKNLSQSELAQLLNVSQKTISDYELSRTEPDIKNLKKLSKFFNVSIDFLVDNKRSDNKILIELNKSQVETIKNLAEQINISNSKNVNIIVGNNNTVKDNKE